MEPSVDKLSDAFRDACKTLDHLKDLLLKIYEEIPGIFVKSPLEMSASDQLRSASSILKLINQMEKE